MFLSEYPQKLRYLCVFDTKVYRYVFAYKMSNLYISRPERLQISLSVYYQSINLLRKTIFEIKPIFR